MKIIPFREFDRIYQDSVRSVFKLWTQQMQVEIAVHNQGWTPALYDFRHYLEASSVRYYKAYQSFAKKGNNQTICDVGGFWGLFQ